MRGRIAFFFSAAILISQAFSFDAHAMGLLRKGWGSGGTPRNVEMRVYEGDIRDRRPVEGALIQIDGGPSATTDADGTVMMQIMKGTWMATVAAQGFHNVNRRISVKKDGSISFPMTRSEAPIQSYDFVIEAFEGSPSNNKRVPGARVTVDSETRIADGNGFTHFFIRSGPHTIKITANGFKDFERNYTVDRPHIATASQPSFKAPMEKISTGGGICYPRLTRTDQNGYLTEAAAYVKERNPELFVSDNRVNAYHMMTKVINILRHHGHNVGRTLNHPTTSEEPGSIRWGTDALGIKSGSAWAIYDLYDSWPHPGTPNAKREVNGDRGDSGVQITADLIAIGSGTRCN